MIHNELLALLKDYASKAGLRMDRNCWLILSDVVELHKPDEKGKYCIYDSPEWEPVEYPCHTIKAIEKELL